MEYNTSSGVSRGNGRNKPRELSGGAGRALSHPGRPSVPRFQPLLDQRVEVDVLVGVLRLQVRDDDPRLSDHV